LDKTVSRTEKEIFNMKKFLALVMALTLCLTAVSFASAEDTDPADVLTDGVWSYSFPVEGMGDFVYYFHFYKDVPGYGGVFYAGFALNQLNFAGTWTVDATEREYTVYMNHGDQETVTATAPYTITFYDWNGNVLDACAFDGEKIYNDMETVYGMYSSPCVYEHVTDVENSKFASTYAEEKDMTILSFVAEDPTCTMTIYHTGRYMDLVGMMVEGNWSMTENEDGSRVYTLTPDLEEDVPAVLTISADGATAHYVNNDGEEMDMTSTTGGPAVSYAFNGSYSFMEGVEAAMTLNLYDDNTCEVSVDVFGTVATLDTGAWSMADDGYTFNFTLVKAGEVSSELNSETYQPELHYVQTGTDIGDIDTVLTLAQ
jgi:hypothetical protein